jgi:hypothetical protein
LTGPFGANARKSLARMPLPRVPQNGRTMMRGRL